MWIPWRLDSPLLATAGGGDDHAHAEPQHDRSAYGSRSHRSMDARTDFVGLFDDPSWPH